ncbi:hypothetical protein G7Y79_00005g016320 [Physcia stellaris]|nr:hypothetical protein G7Y79_00005g016320 [Physcia stellaris]
MLIQVSSNTFEASKSYLQFKQVKLLLHTCSSVFEYQAVTMSHSSDSVVGLLQELFVGRGQTAINWGWSGRPLNDIGKQVEEGDHIKLKIFVTEAGFTPQALNITGKDPTSYAEQVCSEFAENGFWAKAIGGDGQWGKATEFTVQKIHNTARTDFGWGLSAMFQGKIQYLSNHGDWVNYFKETLFHNRGIQNLFFRSHMGHMYCKQGVETLPHAKSCRNFVLHGPHVLQTKSDEFV